MRNYYNSLQLNATAAHDEIAETLQISSGTNVLDKQHRADAHDILLDDQRRQLYANTVELYKRLHQASGCLSTPGSDSHSWQKRLAAFESIDDDADLL